MTDETPGPSPEEAAEQLRRLRLWEIVQELERRLRGGFGGNEPPAAPPAGVPARPPRQPGGSGGANPPPNTNK